MLWQKPQSETDEDDDEDMHRAGQLYKRYRTIEELPDTAKVFFEAAGEPILVIRLHVTVVLTRKSLASRHNFEDTRDVRLPA